VGLSERVTRGRVVIQLEFRGGPTQGYWLVIEPNDVSVCLKHPGHDIDVLVTADIMAFYRVWLGRSTLAEAVRRSQVRLDGTPADLRAFSHWFAWSPMANAVRAALPARSRAPARGYPLDRERRRLIRRAPARRSDGDPPARRSDGWSPLSWCSACSPRRSGASGRYWP
jgi:hypothetical protein